MEVRLAPRPLSGTLAAIPSKSDAHRKLICAALADGPTTMNLSTPSADIMATEQCLHALGADFTQNGSFVTVTPISTPATDPLLECRESGSTLRFLLPVAAALCPRSRFTGSGRLPQRPIEALRHALEAHGAVFSSPQLPLTVTGRLSGGAYTLPGNISSQYITGLLLALPLLARSSTLTLTTRLESAAYVDISLAALGHFGIQVERQEHGYTIPGNQRYRSPGAAVVEGDWSNAAFFLVAGAIGRTVTVTGLDPLSPQGDRAVLDILRRFGAAVQIVGSAATVAPSPLQGCTVDVSEIPDLLPALAVLATAAEGETHFINAARLRLKESDRLTAVAAMLQTLGGDITELPEGLVVRGGPLRGGQVDSFHDHRIAMAAAVAAIRCSGEVAITDAGAVEKSYPAFFTDYQRLGGEAYVL